MANGEKKKCPECKAGAPQWMTTYGDMVTLLLTFFVAMIAMSTISPGKFQQVAAGIRFAFGGKPPSVLTGGKSMNEEPLITSKPGVYRELIKLMESPEYKGKITIEETDKGTLIILKDMVFFEPGSAKLTAQAKELLAKVGIIVIEHTTNVLEIYGYTDDRPLPPNSIYQSNWHLGAARAASVALFFTRDLRKRREIERITDIRMGRFPIDVFYDSDRFVPIGVGDKAILKEIKALRNMVDAKKSILGNELKSGKITQKEWKEKILELERDYQRNLEELRRKYRRIDILIKREKL